MGRGERDADRERRWAEETAAELYAAQPAGFTELRDRRAAQARAEGMKDAARRVRALHRPTVAAWAGNLLVLRRPEETRRVLELGEAIRRAQRELDPAGLRELSARQREVVAALSGLAARLAEEAGRPLPPAARREVESTLRAVIADAEAATAWATGRLTAPLTPPSGLPSATDDAGGPAPAAGGPRGSGRLRTRAPGRTAKADRERERREEKERERKRREADRELRERQEAQRAARTARDTAREARDAAREAVGAAERELAGARERARTADQELRTAEKESRDADRALERATGPARAAHGKAGGRAA